MSQSTHKAISTDEFEVNPERLEQEIVLYAEKLDISEELLRFRTHLNHIIFFFGSFLLFL